uniref:Peptidase family M48 n=1 Tax=Candidatus Kentrum sp. LFY TaxID=2126342 RepID=A0A450X460_9GAMM|nr:MAG: Peptidase family M48 [Candidatus Kentron sp. LFY]
MSHENVISNEELKKLLHPNEKSRFLIALLATIPVIILSLVLIFFSTGIAILLIGGIAFLVWVALNLMKAELIGRSVKVSQYNFPEIYEVLVEVKTKLSYTKDVDVYIIEASSVNAILYKFFQTKFIVLNSDLVDAMPIDQCRGQLVWIIGRFIGALKARHLRLQLLSIIVNSVEKLIIFNLFLFPYNRATQYSGDQIGMALCKDIPGSIMSLNKILIGKDLAEDIRLKGLLEQASELHFSFFGWLSKILSPFPHMTDRYLNLVAFAQSRYPNEFQNYIEQFNDITISRLKELLPKYYSFQENQLV